MTNSISPAPDSRAKVQDFVSRRVRGLQERLFSAGGAASATRQLAQLRRVVASAPGVSPETWSIEFEEMPSSLVGRGDRTSEAEWAVHGAMTLYAVHQQSKDTRMHVACTDETQTGFGTAVKRLARVTSSGEALEYDEMPRRFSALVTATSMQEVLHYARQIVQQLRAQSIPLDYGKLAGQLFDYQNPFRCDGVRLEWGREYSRRVHDAGSGDGQASA